VTRNFVKTIYRKRDEWSHKYDYGHLLVIGGSKQYSGSPAFNALAALRAGTDLVTIVAPKRAANIIANFTPDLICYPLNCDYFSLKNLREVLSLLKGKTAVSIGGGLGRMNKTMTFVRKFLQKTELPTVIDADAIYAVSKHMQIIKEKKVVLTPHTYEFFVLSGMRVGRNLKKRIKAVESFARKWKVVILLKGHIDIISNGEETFINKTGSPYMTKGGLGDVLTGIVGALLARKVRPIDAAKAAAWINGKAGEIAARKFGEGLLASDVVECIPLAIKFK